MLYSATQPTLARRTKRSWVQNPHGAATVSGERAPSTRPPRSRRLTQRDGPPLCHTAWEGAGAAQRSASQETWSPGPSRSIRGASLPSAEPVRLHAGRGGHGLPHIALVLSLSAIGPAVLRSADRTHAFAMAALRRAPAADSADGTAADPDPGQVVDPDATRGRREDRARWTARRTRRAHRRRGPIPRSTRSACSNVPAARRGRRLHRRSSHRASSSGGCTSHHHAARRASERSHRRLGGAGPSSAVGLAGDVHGHHRARTSRLRQLETVSDAIRTVPGFTVGRNGGRGALTSVFPRGGESDYTLVLVDGMRVNASAAASIFPCCRWGRRAGRGRPRPAKCGLRQRRHRRHRVVTTRHGGPPTGSASIEGGRRRWSAPRRVARPAVGRWSFGGGAEHNAEDGFTGIAPATGERVSNDDWRSATVAGSASWSKSAMTMVRGDVRWVDSERGNPGPFGSNPIGAYTAVDTVARGLDTHRQLACRSNRRGDGCSPVASSSAAGNVADLDNRFHSSFGDSFFETRRTTARAQTDVVPTASTGLTFGVEGFSERARSTYFTGEAVQRCRSSAARSARFGEVRQQLGQRLSVTAGLRVDSIRRNALEGDPTEFVERPTFPVDAVTSVNPRVSAAYLLVAGQSRHGTDEGARQRRNGHSAAGRFRDCVHRQPLARTRAQPQHGCRRRATLSPPAHRRRDRVFQPL